MSAEELFARQGTKELSVGDHKFKYKLITGGDELDWADDYTDIKKIDGKLVGVANTGKLARCKLRNIIEVPWSQEVLKDMTGMDKPFSEYSNADKDLLFDKLDGNVISELLKQINSGSVKKKDSSSD